MDPSLAGLGDILIGSLLVVVGLVAIALSLIRRQGIDPLLASFGAFTALYGTRLVLGNPLAPALGVSRDVSIWIGQMVTYVILVPAWYFFWKLLGDGWHRLNFWWVKVVSAFALVAIASDVLQATPGTLAEWNNWIVLLGLLVIVITVWGCRGRMTTDLRILIGGLSIFGLFAINENLVPLGLLPWSWRGETGGFLIFVGCLGWIAARRFVATERELASVEGELEAAKNIQASILPSRAPDMDDLAIAYRFQPSSAVAGDFVDFLTPAAKQLGVMVADVSGHGVPAALIASMVKVAVSSCADYASRPAELLARVNQILCGSFQHGFVSAVYLFLDLERREAIVASGGHPFPLLQRRSKESLSEIGGSGVILGRFPDARFEEQCISVEAEDRLILFTDGIVEAQDADDEMFSEARLRSAITKNRSQPADGLCDALMRDLNLWTGVSARRDDLTFVVVDILASQPSEV